MTYKTMLFFQSMLNYMLGIWPSSHATALCQADHFCFVPSSVSSSTDRLAPLMPLMRTSESPQPRSLRETTIAIYCTMILTTIIYTYVYIYKRYMRVYNYYHFFDWFLKKNRCERVKEQKWLLGRGKDSHQLRLFGHLPPPVEDFVGRGHRGGAVPSYRADRDGLFVALRGLSIAFQRNNSDRRVVAW